MLVTLLAGDLRQSGLVGRIERIARLRRPGEGGGPIELLFVAGRKFRRQRCATGEN